MSNVYGATDTTPSYVLEQSCDSKNEILSQTSIQHVTPSRRHTILGLGLAIFIAIGFSGNFYLTTAPNAGTTIAEFDAPQSGGEVSVESLVEEDDAISDNCGNNWDKLQHPCSSKITDVGLQKADQEVEEMEESSSTILTSRDFLEFGPVRAWLEDDIGLDISSASESDLAYYVPTRIEISYERDLIRGEIGEDAEGGYVAFDLTYYDKTASTYTSSLFVVMNLNGTLKTVVPTSSIGSYDDLHFCGLKLIAPDKFLLGGNTGSSEYGPQYVFEWEKDNFIEQSNGELLNCHDVQLSYTEDGIWSPGTVKSIYETNATTGRNILNFSLNNAASDINHVGMLERDRIAIVSSRMTNSIVKVNMDTKEIDWIAGGTNGSFDLETLSGEVLEAGNSIFVGQHNAEYFGQDEYLMFDNQYAMGNASRLLIVEIDEKRAVAKEVWDYQIAPYPWGFTPIYGDCDRLPTGNILGSFWPDSLSGEKHQDILFETRIVEVERATKKVAWQADVYGGSHCSENICAREYEGWKVYSVERFYTEPLVYEIICTSKMLRFKTQNTFKQNNKYSGRYILKDANTGDKLSAGHLTWDEHWHATKVHIDVENLNITGTNVEIIVINQFDRVTMKYIQC